MAQGSDKKISRRQLVKGGVVTLLTSSTIMGSASGAASELYWFYDDISKTGVRVDHATWLQKHRERAYRRSNDPDDVMFTRYARYQEVLKEYTKGAALHLGKISLKMPDIAENGYSVPFKASVIGKPENVEALLLFAPFNEIPEIGRFYFTALSGHSFVKGRMRLAATQEVVAVAKTKNGQFFTQKNIVIVNIASCFR